MEKYKSVVVVKYTRRGMARAIDRTMRKMTYRGFEFVQMTGNPLESVVMLFKIEGNEKPELTRKEMKALIKADKEKAKLLKEEAKAEAEENKRLMKEDKEKARLLKEEAKVKDEEAKRLMLENKEKDKAIKAQLAAEKKAKKDASNQEKAQKSDQDALEKELRAKQKFAEKEAEKAKNISQITDGDKDK